MKTFKHVRNLAITAFISLLIFHWPYMRAMGRKSVGYAEPCPWGQLARVPLSAIHFECLRQWYALRVKPLEYDAKFDIQQFSTPTRRFWLKREGSIYDGKALLAVLLAEDDWITGSSRGREVRRGDVVVDVGAHVGTFGDDALRRGASRVVMVEPDPINTECIRRNFSREIADGRVIVLPEGAWSTRDTVQFHTGVQNSGTGSMVFNEKGSTEFQVKVRPLDEMLRELGIGRIDFIKMDIEGAEREALKGAQQTLKSYRPRLMLDAYHLPDDSDVLPRLIHKANAEYRDYCPICTVREDRQVVPYVIFFQ